MIAGRIESYIHNDNITKHKGAALVKVTCQTDFAARTDEFIAFARKVAKLAYAFGAGNAEEGSASLDWDELLALAGTAEVAGSLEAERLELAKSLRETIAVREIVILLL